MVSEPVVSEPVVVVVNREPPESRSPRPISETFNYGE